MTVEFYFYHFFYISGFCKPGNFRVRSVELKKSARKAFKLQALKKKEKKRGMGHGRRERWRGEEGEGGTKHSVLMLIFISFYC